MAVNVLESILELIKLKEVILEDKELNFSKNYRKWGEEQSQLTNSSSDGKNARFSKILDNSEEESVKSQSSMTNVFT